MKNATKLFLLLFLAAFTQKGFAQTTSPDSMVHRIFATLKNKDEKAFLELYPNTDQMVKMLSRMMSGLAAELAKMDTTRKEQVNATDFKQLMLEELKQKATPEEVAKMNARYIQQFQKVIKNGEKKGIDWSSTTLTKYTIDTSRQTDEMMMKLFGTNEMRTMNGTIFFTSGKDAYQLNFKEVLYFPEEKGWYGVKLRELRKEGEPADKDILSGTVREIEQVQESPTPKKTTSSKKPVQNTKKKTS